MIESDTLFRVSKLERRAYANWQRCLDDNHRYFMSGDFDTARLFARQSFIHWEICELAAREVRLARDLVLDLSGAQNVLPFPEAARDVLPF